MGSDHIVVRSMDRRRCAHGERCILTGTGSSSHQEKIA
jgi:hypothetical protein